MEPLTFRLFCAFPSVIVAQNRLHSSDDTKPFTIEKRVVFEAYKRVKAKKGSAGIDGESIEAFEADLGNNLYKLWNRLYCADNSEADD